MRPIVNTPHLEDFNARPKGPEPTGLQVRAATRDDIGAIAKLLSERDQRPLDEVTTQLIGEFERMERGVTPKYFCVATTPSSTDVVGFGKTTFLPTDTIEGAEGMPPGWYLTGIVVEPNMRRCGIGQALCQHRLDWLQERTDTLYYYTSTQNLASIALHNALGFVELTRDFAFPNMTFVRGTGILFELRLRPMEGPHPSS